MTKRLLRPYVDRGVPGTIRYLGDRMPLVKEPPTVPLKILTIPILRHHNKLEPPLQATNRVLLRWAESGGSGLPNPEADIRELHYDPLPSDLQERVDLIVDGSPWGMLTRKWYRTTLDRKDLAVALRISRTQLYADWRAALWYFTGRFESERIYG